MVSKRTVNTTNVVNMSVGSALAIFTIWLFATALTVFAALLFFTDVIVINSTAFAEIKESQDTDGATLAFLILGAITVLPCIGAFWLTTMIITGGDD